MKTIHSKHSASLNLFTILAFSSALLGCSPNPDKAKSKAEAAVARVIGSAEQSAKCEQLARQIHQLNQTVRMLQTSIEQYTRSSSSGFGLSGMASRIGRQAAAYEATSQLDALRYRLNAAETRYERSLRSEVWKQLNRREQRLVQEYLPEWLPEDHLAK